MPEPELRQIITGIVDAKLEVFRGELQLELLPIKVAVESHTQQLAEQRALGILLQNGQARIEGRLESFSEAQHANHAQNVAISQEGRKATTELLQLLHSHIGEHDGTEKHKAETEKHLERRSEKRRDWIKLGLGAVSGGSILKWIHDHWSHFHSR